MKFLLLGKGKTILAISKFLKKMKQEYYIACLDHEIENDEMLYDYSLLSLSDIDYVIKSPGISQKDNLFIKIKKKFKVIAELDLFYLFQIKTKVIAITGTNGKTTCVSMIQHLLKKAHFNSVVCGNSHRPIFEYEVHFEKLDYLVVECSSFQLEDLSYYHPHISSIINLQPNHLDSVNSLKTYYESKMNIYKYCDALDYFIYNPEIKLIKRKKIKASIRYLDSTLLYKMDFSKDILKYKIQILILYEIKELLHIDTKTFIETINTFKPLPYRQQQIIVSDITFINDSKSTSVDATLFAFSNIDQQKNIILIIGGKDKNLNYQRLKKLPYYRLVVYGQIKDKVSHKIKNTILFDDLEQAFKYATSLKIKQKVILFSPATSSFDQYQNYMERGAHFNQLIEQYRSKENE